MQGPRRPYQNAKPLAAGTLAPSPGTGVYINCTAAGTIRLTLKSGDTIDATLNTGPSLLESFEFVGYSVVSTFAGTVSLLS